MRSLRRLAAAALLSLVATVTLAWAANCTDHGRAVLDVASGDTPEQRVAAYITAVSRGDDRAAHAAWQIGSAPSALRAEDATATLRSAGVRAFQRTERIEWWWMCCAAVRPATSRDDATFARLTVSVALASGDAKTYVFDVSAADHTPMFDGLPARDWRIVAVHVGEPPPVPGPL